MDQQERSATQFGSNAEYYLSSPVHATGADLDRLSELAAGRSRIRALDLGCGAGHASFALARGGALEVVACDPSPQMLGVVAAEARARGYDAVRTQVGAAESLAFATGSFDLVVTRYAAHHWASVPRALAEARRVLAPGGRIIVIDVISPEAPLLDTSLQALEVLRDGSHVRNYRLSEWIAMLQAAGFAAPSVSRWRIPIEYRSWISRIGTPPRRVEALQAVFADLPDEVRAHFEIDAGCSFRLDVARLEASSAS